MKGVMYPIDVRWPHIKVDNVTNLVLKNNCYIRPFTRPDMNHILEHELELSNRYWRIPDGSLFRLNAYEYSYCIIFPKPVHGYAGFMCHVNCLVQL
jgi:hypothetical protein